MIRYEKLSDINAVVRELKREAHGEHDGGGCSNCCHDREGCPLGLPMRIDEHPERLTKFCKNLGILPSDYFDYFEKWNPFYCDEIRHAYFDAAPDDSIFPRPDYDYWGRGRRHKNPCWHRGCDWLDCTLLHSPFGKIVAPTNGKRFSGDKGKQESCVWQNEKIKLTLVNDNIIRYCNELDAAVVRSRFVGIKLLASQGVDVLRIRQWRRQTTEDILDLVLRKAVQYNWETVGTLVFGNKRHDEIIPMLEQWEGHYPKHVRMFYIHPEDYLDLRKSLGCPICERPKRKRLSRS